MKFFMNVDPGLQEESVHLNVREMSRQAEQIRRIAESDERRDRITVERDDRSYIISVNQVSHVISEGGKNFAVSGEQDFIYRETLKHFESQFGEYPFIRVSKYCLANIDWMEYFEAGFSGNLMLKFKNGRKVSVSRKYVKNLKKLLEG